MLTHSIDLSLPEAYRKLKICFVENGCVAIDESEPTQIRFRQGSMWGVTPKNAKKTINATLKATGGKTEVAMASAWTEDWLYLTVGGCIFAALFAGIAFWLAVDLSGFLAGAGVGVWSSLIAANSLYLGPLRSLVSLAYGLGVFLLAVILVEAAITVNVKKNLDAFAQEVLCKLG
ncbi:MAG: hypothetical protein NWE92_01220 [Candidatus Bathyarchaeota archaeon]|nr:hypothetical protein [Candidatus Bathyarchaeota archaeon]